MVDLAKACMSYHGEDVNSDLEWDIPLLLQRSNIDDLTEYTLEREDDHHMLGPDRFDFDIDNDGVDNWKDLYDNGSDASRDHDNDGLNEDYTVAGIPRFPVGVTFRDYE